MLVSLGLFKVVLMDVNLFIVLNQLNSVERLIYPDNVVNNIIYLILNKYVYIIISE